MSDTMTSHRLKVGQRVKATPTNNYIIAGNITAGGLGTVVSVSDRNNAMYPYEVQYDEFNVCPLWTAETEVEAAE